LIEKFLAKVGDGKTILHCLKNQSVFSQGEAADAVFYIQQGNSVDCRNCSALVIEALL
jgi:hypothetical protein